jgi:asparagine N-glycosylation enzyme membrane subunit Stt3
MFWIATAIIVASLSLFVPGILLAFGLLRKTELHVFEILIIGLIFGMIFPATMTWAESYLMNYIHFFTFSMKLFELNALLLTIIGAVLCYSNGFFKDLFNFAGSMGKGIQSAAAAAPPTDVRHALERSAQGKAIVKKHMDEERSLQMKHDEEMKLAATLSAEERERISVLHKDDQSNLLSEHMREEQTIYDDMHPQATFASTTPQHSRMWIVWTILAVLMLLSFATRIINIGTSPKFFEFDPYFDMLNTESILTFGYQLLLSPSAWPAVPQGTVLRAEPLIPYLEAYWYDLANYLGPHYTTFSTNLMSYVGSIYPPIAAALLVFVVFLLLYHEYDATIGLIGAALATTMPVLYTTFIAGEQLLEPWGIFGLFFFLASYMLAVRNPKDKKLAILAGIAFAANFLGAQYFTVTAGILAAYIVLQGIIGIIRKERTKDFYIMNAVVLAVIILFYIIYNPYNSTLTNRIPDVLGVPTIVAFPLAALIFVAAAEYITNILSPKLQKSLRGMPGGSSFLPREVSILALTIIVLLLLFLTPLGNPIRSYLNLSARFTTPSKPLFMTVQEYIPTGLLYDFGGQGFGTIGADIFGIPILVWLVSALSLVLIAISIIYRRSRTGILYMAIALPLMFAGFSEVKYLPHLGVVYIVLFCIILGEIMYLAQDSFKLKIRPADADVAHINGNFYTEHAGIVALVIGIGVFFIFGAIITAILLICMMLLLYYTNQNLWPALWPKCAAALGLLLIIVLASFFGFAGRMMLFGENSSMISAIQAAYIFSIKPTTACTTINNDNNVLGASIFCNTVPNYWLSAMSWIKSNVGPYGPRVLSWWDYGDWINWFGNTNAVLRGDNAVAAEDYATAANLVLGAKYNYTSQQLANFMNTNQSKYLLLDEDLISKWQALNFLACIHINATSEAYAFSQGVQQGEPYILGSSQCEMNNDPLYTLVPISALVQNSTQQSISDYCTISTSKNVYARGYIVEGNGVSNNTVCVSLTPNKQGVLSVYNTTGAKIDAVLQSSYYQVVNLDNSYYVEFLMIYLPGANGTVQNPPSGFYASNYYDGFILGKLKGFTEVYPSNATGINLVNATYPVRIFALNNYTGGNAPVPTKPSWVQNNYTMP